MRALLLSLVAGMFLLPAYAQKKIKLASVDKKLDSVKHYHKILIVGEGGMQSRMYMDHLSPELIKELKAHNIECKYEYLGDPHKVDTDYALKKAEAWPHDAVLRFYPLAATENLSTHYINTAPMMTHTGAMSYTGSGSLNEYYLVDDFEIFLTEGPETIWSARLSTSIEMGKNTVYKRIRKVILDDMAKQNVLTL
ncbi:hypothetical protein [Chitinophaga filiformis]|uniref:DUF4159 domain-containing protein n=1 Tax=Chitinophaga filiformis TaxID=104663 RepID=A0A1G7JF50_CHIFI|nr:hypothetical protein [Chitinophaga filiformis]SDF23548.1 hypothetical protein SAMN04488121_1011215 [Chitinophaga filiformis]